MIYSPLGLQLPRLCFLYCCVMWSIPQYLASPNQKKKKTIFSSFPFQHGQKGIYYKSRLDPNTRTFFHMKVKLKVPPAHDPMMDDQEAIIMAALSILNPPQLADLTHSISSLFHLLHRRLYTILSVPMLYSLTLRHLQSLPLQHKSLLIARHLLSNLTILAAHLMMQKGSINTCPPKTYFAANSMTLRDLDAVVLLLLLCEIRHLYPEMLETTAPSNLRPFLYNYISRDMLTLSGIEASGSHVLIKYVEMVAKCKRFVSVMGFHGGDGGNKSTNETATSVAVVVMLPSVEVMSGNTKECLICKEDMKQGRDVCKLPCDHLFHWMCILPWLKKNNTCPCCRYSLPTDDVFTEIDRLWELLAKMGGGT